MIDNPARKGCEQIGVFHVLVISGRSHFVSDVRSLIMLFRHLITRKLHQRAISSLNYWVHSWWEISEFPVVLVKKPRHVYQDQTQLLQSSRQYEYELLLVKCGSCREVSRRSICFSNFGLHWNSLGFHLLLGTRTHRV